MYKTVESDGVSMCSTGGYSTVVEPLPGTGEALSSIPHTAKKKRQANKI